VEELSPVFRPVTLRELADFFEMPVAQLDRLATRYRIAPACRIGGVRVYGPKQVKRLYAALHVANA
jgi:hypothetical protein